MDLKNNLGDLMKQAQEMQEKMQTAQKEIINTTAEGEAGAGLAKCVINGRHEVLELKFNPNLMDEDIEMIEDLGKACINDAVQKLETISKDKIKQLTSGLNIPTDFELPKDEG